jgi:sulfate adenylyltransferase subunit 2
MSSAIADDATTILHPQRLNHLQALEAESIAIMREAVAEFARPVMLYSIGKDSSVMLRLAQKAFFPGKIPFPLLHVDTSYKFPEMILFRDAYAKEIGADLIVHRNEEAIAAGANPYTLGTQNCCGLLKTRSLLDALAEGGFDAAFGGARRDEEKGSGTQRISDRSCGASITRVCAKARASVCFRSRTGRSWISGSICTPRRFRLCPCTLHRSVP